jgi:GNAT superfamily N-acetyltransferase
MSALLYPHRVKRRVPLYPHVPKRKSTITEGWQWNDTKKIHAYKFDGDYLYQIWEHEQIVMPSRTKEIIGEVRVHERENWENVPKKNWSVIPSIGWCYYRIDIADKTGRIRDIYVQDRFQRKSFGSKLIAIAEWRMKNYGVLTVGGSSLPEAKSFWRKLGYIIQNSEMVKNV